MREQGDIIVVDTRSGVDSYLFDRQEEMSALRFFKTVGSTDYQRLFIQFLRLNEKEASLREKILNNMSTLSNSSVLGDEWIH